MSVLKEVQSECSHSLSLPAALSSLWTNYYFNRPLFAVIGGFNLVFGNVSKDIIYWKIYSNNIRQSLNLGLNFTNGTQHVHSFYNNNNCSLF